MASGRAENRRFDWFFGVVNPHCWFVPDDGSFEAAVVLRNTNPQAFRCSMCRTIVIIGEGQP
jgi:hypothetical protein